MGRPRKKRYLGMTLPQLMVLGGMFLLLCCILSIGYWWLNSVVIAAYRVPNQPVVDLTSLPTSTPMPTETAVPTPTATSIPYESLIPSGWKIFLPTSAPEVQIWLPARYVAQTSADKKNAIPILHTEGADSSEGVESLLLLKDTAPSPYLILTTFELVRLPVFDVSLDQMIEDQFGALTRAGRLQERNPFVFLTEPYPAQRLVFDINTNGVDAGLVVYVVQVGNNVYYLNFATPFNELFTRLPEFDQTAQTFRIVPIPPTSTAPPPTETPVSP